MKRFFHLCFLFHWLTGFSLFAQSTAILPLSQFSFEPMGSFGIRYGFGGWQNPAVLAVHPGFELLGSISYTPGLPKPSQWGISVLSESFALTKIQTRTAENTLINNYRIAVGFGNHRTAIGLAYERGTNPLLQKSSYSGILLGLITRPIPRFFTVGITYSALLNQKGGYGIAEIGIRPFATPALLIYGNFALSSDQNIKEGFWKFGAASELLHGLRFFTSYDAAHRITAGIQLSITEAFGISTHLESNTDFSLQRSTYQFRVGGYDRNVQKQFFPKKQILRIGAPRRIFYTPPHLFSSEPLWRDILSQIEAAAKDPEFSAIVINLDQFPANGAFSTESFAWEFRRSLAKWKEEGKAVIVYLTRATFPHLLIASVADRVVLDPYGEITLLGYSYSRTYYKELLDSIGLGIDELRLFKYKSAIESFARSEMSEGEKEQMQQILEDWYNQTRTTVATQSESLLSMLDTLIDSVLTLNPSEAFALGIVDTVGRWDLADSIAKALSGTSTFVSHYDMEQSKRYLQDMFWHIPPQIAVIYAIGVCAMDEGITARKLVKDVEEAVQNPNVKAIVLRVDSPGGDPLASDYIAKALRKAKGKKPVIISQGFVAASGGYWLSMDGDTIVTTPYTLTGSIGVIGAWIYNKGLADKLHLHLSGLKRGEHSDLLWTYDIPLPLLGSISIPARNLTEKERERFFYQIRQLYQDFVQRVATGRDTTSEYIESIAQGRVWTGVQAKQRGLADLLGSLTDAITIAREAAGISASEPFEIIEYPKPPLFPSFLGFLNQSQSIQHRDTTFGAFEQYLKLIQFQAEHNGKPLVLMPIEFIDPAMLYLYTP